MSEVVNLNQFKKAKARSQKKAEADANAVKFGRTKAQRLAEAARDEKAKKHLDQHRFEEE